DDVALLPDGERSPRTSSAASDAKALSTDQALAQLERWAAELEELQRTHRAEILGAVATGTSTADAAIVRVDTLRSLRTLTRHAWRSMVHLVGRDWQPGAAMDRSPAPH